MAKLTKPKPFEQLKCSDNFMFAKVMEDAFICKKVLEVLMCIKIGKLSYPEPEKTIQTAPDAKGIRLDVHTSDGRHEFDVEMQTTLYKKLPKRSRYYQGIMDVDYLLKGHEYSELKENIVIFICLKDPFKKKLPVYTFENVCQENNSLKLQDKVLKMFYNHRQEKKIKMTARAYKEYMDYCMLQQESYEQGVEDGVEQGIEQEKLEAARNMLSANLASPEKIAAVLNLSFETVLELAGESN